LTKLQPALQQLTFFGPLCRFRRPCKSRPNDKHNHSDVCRVWRSFAYAIIDALIIIFVLRLISDLFRCMWAMFW